MKTHFNKEEFMVMALVYAAYIDNDLNSNEVKELLNKTQEQTLLNVGNRLDKMSHQDIIDCFNEANKTYASSESERSQLIKDMRSMIEADDRIYIIEVRLCDAVERLLLHDIKIPGKINGLFG